MRLDHEIWRTSSSFENKTFDEKELMSFLWYRSSRELYKTWIPLGLRYVQPLLYHWCYFQPSWKVCLALCNVVAAQKYSRTVTSRSHWKINPNTWKSSMKCSVWIHEFWVRLSLSWVHFHPINPWLWYTYLNEQINREIYISETEKI